jgi:hypothetical protein
MQSSEVKNEKDFVPSSVEPYGSFCVSQFREIGFPVFPEANTISSEKFSSHRGAFFGCPAKEGGKS